MFKHVSADKDLSLDCTETVSPVFMAKLILFDKTKNESGVQLLFSLVQVQNKSFGPKQHAKFTVNHHHHPPPTYQKLFAGF